MKHKRPECNLKTLKITGNTSKNRGGKRRILHQTRTQKEKNNKWAERGKVGQIRPWSNDGRLAVDWSSAIPNRNNGSVVGQSSDIPVSWNHNQGDSRDETPAGWNRGYLHSRPKWKGQREISATIETALDLYQNRTSISSLILGEWGELWFAIRGRSEMSSSPVGCCAFEILRERNTDMESFTAIVVFNGKGKLLAKTKMVK